MRLRRLPALLPAAAVAPRVRARIARPLARLRRRIARRRAERPSLRLVLALSLGPLGLASTWTLAVLVTREATARLEAEIGAQLGELAEHTARSLDRGMFERWRDMQVAASVEALRDADAPLEAKRAVLERLQRTYPAYALIALVDPAGRIEASSNGLLVGADVARRDYFLAGRERSFVGDVHDAILLAKLLPPGADEPLRLVDLAVPVRAADGALVGVLAAHLDWEWARETARTLARSLKGRREGAEILILARDGTVLLGPLALRGRVLAADAVSGGRPVADGSPGRIGRWPDGAEDHVSALEPTSGYRDYPGLGWRVVVRQSAGRALQPVLELRRHILVSGSLVALGAAMLAWFMAGRIARPLQDLAQAAGALGRDAPLPPVSPGPVRESRMLAGALAAASCELRQREETHRLLVDELNHRVKNTLATVQAIAAQSLKGLGGEAAAGRAAFEARLLALSRAHTVLTRESWSSAGLHGLVAEAVRPFGGEAARLTVDGPRLRIAPQTALSLTMILHELCTNAAKYGALSAASGSVAITWEVVRESGSADATTLRLVWRERGGPPVHPPSRKGFGTRLIERGLNSPSHGAAALDYAPAGVVCTLALALDAAEPPAERPAAEAARAPDEDRSARRAEGPLALGEPRPCAAG